MTRYTLEIEQDSTGSWIGTSDLYLEEGKTTYIVIGETLEGLRKSVQEGVNGDLGIAEISFEEVFLTNSEVTGF